MAMTERIAGIKERMIANALADLATAGYTVEQSEPGRFDVYKNDRKVRRDLAWDLLCDFAGYTCREGK